MNGYFFYPFFKISNSFNFENLFIKLLYPVARIKELDNKSLSVYLCLASEFASGWLLHKIIGPPFLFTKEKMFNQHPLTYLTLKKRHTLLENMFSISVIYDFLHRFLTDVESIMINIGFLKSMLT